MIKNKTISLVLPCRNEANHLHEVLKLVPSFVDEIIIVSNKSKDNTVGVAKKLAKNDRRIVVLQDDRTIDGIGYGYAHMTGIQAATGDIIVGADSDGTYPLYEIARVVEFMLSKEHDFISCARYPLQEGVKIPFKLQLGVNLLNWEIKLLYNIPIRDALSGMWVFKKSIRDKLNLSMGEWNLSPQIKINAAKHPEISFSQFSISQDQRMGETKQNYFKTGFSHAKWIFMNKFRDYSEIK